MCRAVTCKKCGKTTWAGCGQHVKQVMAGVPAAQRCPGHADRPRRQRRLATQAHRPQLNRHHVAPRPPGPCAPQRRQNWTMVLSRILARWGSTRTRFCPAS